jgi:hypothetical protein
VDKTAILHGVMVGALVHSANEANEMVLKGGCGGGGGGRRDVHDEAFPQKSFIQCLNCSYVSALNLTYQDLLHISCSKAICRLFVCCFLCLYLFFGTIYLLHPWVFIFGIIYLLHPWVFIFGIIYIYFDYLIYEYYIREYYFFGTIRV